MVNPKSLFFGALVATLALPAHAINVQLDADGQWNAFKVSDLESLGGGVEWIDNNDTSTPLHGTPLSFVFEVAAGSVGTLTVVDASFAGDTFKLTNFGNDFGVTSAVAAGTYEDPVDAGVDVGAALLDPRFSSGAFTLAAGSYRIGGLLQQSVTFDGAPLNSTLGGLRLIVAAVPEPGSVALLFAGLGLMASVARRRRG